MTTSLAAQLKKLSVPDAQASLSTDYKQTSFLYDEREAAKFDRQHFYNIGVNGLHQLVAKDERFEEFERSLFSQSSQSVQRLMQTSDVNKQLDDTINKFLLMLSPYMQLREAHKALEWLVNRYNVHLRNVDSFMMCLLPFYDQEPFIMGLRILDMNSSSCRPWKWLEPIKRANTYLPQKSLLAHCRSANGFMGLLCNMLAKHIEASKDSDGNPSTRHLVRVISFFTQTVLGVIMEGTLSEQVLSVLIPTLSKGFKANDLPDYMVSSYMIFSQLLSICTFKKSLLTSMLNVICKNIVQELLPSALGVIVLMFQKQEISKIPEKALKYLMRHQSLTSILSSLCENVKVEPFLTPFLVALTSAALVKYEPKSDSDSEDSTSSVSPFSLLMNIISSVDLDKKSVASVVRTLINWIQGNPDSDDEEMDVDGESSSENKPFEVYRLLERRYFSVLTSTVSKMLESDETDRLKSVVENLQLMSVNKAQQDMKLDPEAFVAVCLNHHQGSVRKNAVLQLLQDTTEMQEKPSVQHAIVMRLQDNDHDVVEAVLQDPKGIWDLFEDKHLLYSTLVKKLDALERSKEEKSSDLKMKLLQTVCCMPESGTADVMETTVLLISYLVPLSQKDMKFSQNLESGCAAFSELLQHLSKGWLSQVKTLQKKQKGDEVFSTLVVNLVEHIAAHVLKQDPLQEMKSLYDYVSKTPRQGCALLVLTLVNASLIAKRRAQELKTSLQRLLITSICNSSLSKGLFNFTKKESRESSSIEAVVCSCLSQLNESSHLDISLIAFCLENLNVSSVPRSLEGEKFWQLTSESSTESNWLWTRIITFNFLLELSSHSNSQVSQLAQQQFSRFLKELGDVGPLTKILCGLWISQVDERHLTVAHQARSLQFAEVYLKSLSDDSKKKIVGDDNSPILPCLLVLLSGRSERARHVSFNLIAALADGVKDETTTFKWFAGKLLKYRQEVENDVAFLSQVMQNILEDSEIEPPSPKKARKRSVGGKPPMSSSGLHYLIDILTDSATPYVIRLGILHACSKLDSLESFIPLMKFLGSLLDKSSTTTAPDEKAGLRHSIKLILHHIGPNVAPCMTVGSDSLNVLQQALNCTDMVLSRGDNVQMLTAGQLSRKLMSALPFDSCQAVFSQLLEISSSTANTEISRCCRKVIKHMKLSSKLIIAELSNVIGKELSATVRETKKQKVSNKAVINSDQDADVLESKPWKRVTALLEIIQNKKTIIDAVPLVPVAFQVLGRVLELETKTSGEYIKQLLLGIIYKICCVKHSDDEDNADAKESAVMGEHLRIELVVQCIRNSDNHHTHHQALLLLSEAAKIAPNLLLHNMMSVFIFMGTSILRQDDEYSFHVIERILENVIPAIRMACEEKNKGNKSKDKKKLSESSVKGKSEDVMTVVLRVFVDAIPHIPSHRKIMLFQKLLTVLGIDDYLWRVVLLFVENVVQRPKTETHEDDHEQSSGPLSAGDLEFLSSLFEAFSTPQCFQCVMVATRYLMKLPEELGKEDHAMKQAKKDITKIDDLSKNDTDIFSVEHHSAKQLRHFKYGSVFALSHLMGSQHLVAELSHQDPESFLSQYQSMMETILQFISQVTKSHDQHQQDVSGRFWKFLLHKCHDLLDNMVNLLPDTMFMTVVCGLMEHSLPMVQKRAMELLNTKLHYYKESGVHAKQRDMLWPIVTRLQVVVKQTLLSKKGKSKEEDVTNGQTAIYGLKVLCRILGEIDHAPFLEVLNLCVKALSRHEDNGTVCASAMLCVAEVVHAAKTHAIEHLKELMPLVIAQLQTPATEHGVLLVAAITSLQKIIEAVPLFLSPYLTDIVVQICTVNSEIEADSQKPVVMQKIKQICTTIATVTSTRTFLPIMENSFKALEDKLSTCAECLLSMLKDHIENMTRESLATFLQDLIKFFFVCFNIRAEHSDMTMSGVAKVEGFVIIAFVALVFKLSEAQFKPMLLQLYSWAIDDEASKDRVLTFYRVCSSLADNLKNLFTLFAGHILKHSADVLNANNKSKSKVKYFGKGKEARKKSCLLLEYVLSCLQKTFHHDTEAFMNKERFDTVMQPLVDQLENMLGKPQVVSERINKFLVPCITSLAHSSKDDHMWKLVNYQVLLKTRNEQEQVRIWALSVVDALHKKLGEDYTHLVAETIPFIAELMEDESDEVEKYTHKVIAAMEVSVGENLQEYF